MQIFTHGKKNEANTFMERVWSQGIPRAEVGRRDKDADFDSALLMAILE
jgi:hypothetical protein